MAITAKEGITRENGIPFVELSGVSFFNAEMTFDAANASASIKVRAAGMKASHTAELSVFFSRRMTI